MRQDTLTPEKRRILIRLQRWNQLRKNEWEKLIDPAITDALLDEDSPDVSVLVLQCRPKVAAIMGKRWEYCPEDKPAGLFTGEMRNGKMMVPFLDELEVCEQIELRVVWGAIGHAARTFVPSILESSNKVCEYSFHAHALRIAKRALSLLRENMSEAGQSRMDHQLQEELA